MVLAEMIKSFQVTVELPMRSASWLASKLMGVVKGEDGNEFMGKTPERGLEIILKLKSNKMAPLF